MEKSLGERLKKARMDKGLSQKEVMGYTNINNKTLSGYENGVSEPDINTLKTLSDLYEVSIDYLSTGRRSPLFEALEMDADKTVLKWFKSLPSETQDFLKNQNNQTMLQKIQDLQSIGCSSEMIQEWLGFLYNNLTTYIKTYGALGRAVMAANDMSEEEKKVIEKLNKKFFSEETRKKS